MFVVHILSINVGIHYNKCNNKVFFFRGKLPVCMKDKQSVC